MGDLAQAQLGTEGAEGKVQELFKQGVQAAQKQEWLSALGYFEEVRRSVPLAPELLFNLGLAEEALTGRELRAMAWFKAYLAVDPDGPNTKALEETCQDLEKTVGQSIAKLLRQAGQLAGRFPNIEVRNQSLIRVIAAQAGVGNIMEAEELVNQIEKEGDRDLAYQKIQAHTGEKSGTERKKAPINGPKENEKTKSLSPAELPEIKKASPENQKRRAGAFTQFIDTKLSKPYFLNPESYFQFLTAQSNPRERFDGLMEAAEKMTEALKEYKKINAGSSDIP